MGGENAPEKNIKGFLYFVIKIKNSKNFFFNIFGKKRAN